MNEVFFADPPKKTKSATMNWLFIPSLGFGIMVAGRERGEPEKGQPRRKKKD